MARVLSALVLVPLVFGVVWWLPAIWTLVLVELVLLLAALEYVSLVQRIGIPVVGVVTVSGALAMCAVVARTPLSRDMWLGPSWLGPALVMSVVVAVGIVQVARGRVEGLLPSSSASVFALVYLAVPLGALVDLRGEFGREVVVLFILVVMASDTFQYYGGRAIGRRALAPTLSPHKTVEGAACGIAGASVVLLVAGYWWLDFVSPVARVLLGASIAACGIAGDLFESGLKRAAQVKDASALIPGHGGMLDRLDAMLFGVPLYYIAVQLQ